MGFNDQNWLRASTLHHTRYIPSFLHVYVLACTKLKGLLFIVLCCNLDPWQQINTCNMAWVSWPSSGCISTTYVHLPTRHCSVIQWPLLIYSPTEDSVRDSLSRFHGCFHIQNQLGNQGARIRSWKRSSGVTWPPQGHNGFDSLAGLTNAASDLFISKFQDVLFNPCEVSERSFPSSFQLSPHHKLLFSHFSIPLKYLQSRISPCQAKSRCPFSCIIR